MRRDREKTEPFATIDTMESGAPSIGSIVLVLFILGLLRAVLGWQRLHKSVSAFRTFPRSAPVEVPAHRTEGTPARAPREEVLVG
jgi:hypothetical protein